MIPILYSADTTSFTTNGLGRLSDAISCTVNEQLNGGFTLNMVYPKDGIHADSIDYKKLIHVKCGDGSYEPFRIKKITDTLDGKKMTIEAEHISYDLSGIPMPKLTATGITNTLSALRNSSLISSGYTFITDLTNETSEFKVKYPRSIRACIGGMDGSIIQLFKCELKFNQRTVRFLSQRGENRGARIRYGKNLESFVSVRTSESSYNGVLAYYYNQDSGTVVQSNIQYANHTFPVDRIFILDVSSEYSDSTPSVSQLNTRAQKYITDNNIGFEYLDSLEIKFVPLWQTEEYKDIIGLEQVELGDTVEVLYEKRLYYPRVIECTYDTLKERYTDLKLGSKKASFSDTIKQIAVESANEVING